MADGPRTPAGREKVWVADVDVHVNEDPVALADHADSSWREHFAELRHASARYLDIPGFSVGWEGIDPPIPGRHADGDPEFGFVDWETRAVNDAGAMRTELDGIGVDAALLIPDHLLTLAALPNPGWAMAIARAYNRWLTAQWLPTQGLFGAIVAPPHDPVAAAAEIRRHAGTAKMVAVYLPTACVNPLWGHRMYDPIFDAAQETRLPVVFHSVAIIHPNFPHNVQGIEPMAMRHALMHPLGMIANLVSILGTGVPVRFPDLRIVFTEAGISWVPFIAWKLDKEYTERRRELPFYDHPPSHYIKRFHYTTQPIEEPEKPAHLVELMEMMSLTSQVMFASDWPHHDFDHPSQVMRLPLADDAKRAVMGANATRVFGMAP